MGGSHGEKAEREEKWKEVKEYRNKMRNKSDPVCVCLFLSHALCVRA